MDWPTMMLIVVGILLMLLASGMRIAFVLTGIGIITLYLWMPANQAPLLAFMTWNTIDSFLLGAIPLFVFMGEIISQGGLSKRIYGAISPVMERMPGGLLLSNIAAGTAFAAATGSALASGITIGKIALPEMAKRGYDRGMAAGSVAASGTLGVLIPPSITMIVYGAMVNESIGKLFIAGIFPGFMLAGLFMTYIVIRVSLQPHLAPRGEPAPWGKSLRGTIHVWPIAFLILVVLGSIYAGVATPTEAGAVGGVGAIFLTLIYRQLNWGVIKAAALGTVKSTSMIMLIFMGAKLMTVPLMNLGVFHALTQSITAMPVPPLVILLSILLMYIILGCFMSGLPVIVMTLPITYPIIVALGYDPIWFGVIIVMLNETGMLTPPVGILLYALHGLQPDRPFSEVAWGVIPFVLVILVAMAILIAFPQIAIWLPSLMLGG